MQLKEDDNLSDKFRLLRQTVVGRSRRSPRGHYLGWDKAKQEWILVGEPTEYDGGGSECVCGTHIKTGYCIRNVFTDAELILGSRCIRHFDRPDLRDMTKAAVSGLKAIKSNPFAPASLALLRYLKRDLRIPTWITDKYDTVKKWPVCMLKDSWVFGINSLILAVFRGTVPSRCQCGAVPTFTQGVRGLNWMLRCPREGGKEVGHVDSATVYLELKRHRR